MRRRLYFVLPDVATAEATMNDLLLARVEERHIHCLARRGMPLGELHEANMLQKSDLVHGTELGSGIGAAGGMLVGIALVLYPPHGMELQAITVLGATALGAVFGAWAAGLVAASVPNSRLLAFSRDIEAGRVLMMVDVPYRRLATIRELVENRHPEAAPKGMEPTIPAFP